MNDLFATLHSGGALAEVFSEQRYVAHCLRFERELAAVQSSLGVIPAAAADEIARVAHPEHIDLAALRARTQTVGLPIVGLVDQLVRLCRDDLGQYVHYGATTQDVMDCAAALQMVEGLGLVDQALDRMSQTLAGLAASHAETLQAGRTNQQHALPVTFGFKAAVWQAALDRHRERLAPVAERVATGQFGGAVGTLASFGEHGVQTRRQLLQRLGLKEPVIAWHSMRDIPAEAASLLSQIGATLGKIGRDALMLSSTEVGELRFSATRGASSTMPQKSNPVAASSVVALSRMLFHTAPMLLDASQVENERSLDAWYIELHALPQCFRLMGALLQQAEAMLAELVVDAGRMARNAEMTAGAIVGESVQMALAQHIGLNRAHELLSKAFRISRADGRPVNEVLQQLLAPWLELKVQPAWFDLQAHLRFASDAVRVSLDSGLSAAEPGPPGA